MRAGPMRHVLTLQKKTRTPDGMGGFTESWSDVTTIRAEVRGLTGSEMIRAGRLDAAKTYRLWTRDHPAIDEDKRFVWGRRVLDILSVAPDNMRSGMEVMAEETGELS